MISCTFSDYALIVSFDHTGKVFEVAGFSTMLAAAKHLEWLKVHGTNPSAVHVMFDRTPKFVRETL